MITFDDLLSHMPQADADDARSVIKTVIEKPLATCVCVFVRKGLLHAGSYCVVTPKLIIVDLFDADATERLYRAIVTDWTRHSTTGPSEAAAHVCRVFANALRIGSDHLDKTGDPVLVMPLTLTAPALKSKLDSSLN